MIEIDLNNDVDCHYFGMEDFEISLNLIDVKVKIVYVAEPPHGDSYHHLFIDEKKFPGYVWGCHFLFPYHQKYIICSWMEELYDRKTLLIDTKTLDYKILKNYYYEFKTNNHEIELMGKDDIEKMILDLSAIEKLFAVK